MLLGATPAPGAGLRPPDPASCLCCWIAWRPHTCPSAGAAGSQEVLPALHLLHDFSLTGPCSRVLDLDFILSSLVIIRKFIVVILFKKSMKYDIYSGTFLIQMVSVNRFSVAYGRHLLSGKLSYRKFSSLLLRLDKQIVEL